MDILTNTGGVDLGRYRLVSTKEFVSNFEYYIQPPQNLGKGVKTFLAKSTNNSKRITQNMSKRGKLNYQSKK